MRQIFIAASRYGIIMNIVFTSREKKKKEEKAGSQYLGLGFFWLVVCVGMVVTKASFHMHLFIPRKLSIDRY